MYVESLKKAMAAFGPVFVQLYGQGEAPMTITGLRRRDHLGNEGLAPDSVLGSVGYARSGVDVAVLAADGRPAAVGEVGEVVCRGDVVMAGYWNDPKATAATLRDGWLHTGDMGAFDAAGHLTLRDRSRTWSSAGAATSTPRGGGGPARAPWRRRGRCGRSAGSGVGRGRGGVHRRAGAPAELDAHLLERIARFKRPKRYLYLDELPKNSYGKVLKRELRARLN